VDTAKPLFAAPPIPAVALVFRMPESRLETVIRELTPAAVQFLDPAEIPMMKRIKAAHPGVALWQSIHLPQAGEAADADHFRATAKSYIAAGVDALLFDTVAVMGGRTKFGGTGRTSDWRLVRQLMDAVESPVPVWLAGGIHPGNAADAINAVAPDGIDLCSGVEARPGRKDPAKIAALMAAIRKTSMNPKPSGER
jgi:phosphoribosylanthranilate isomerase